MKIAGILNSDNYMEFSLRVNQMTAENAPDFWMDSLHSLVLLHCFSCCGVPSWRVMLSASYTAVCIV